MCSWYSKWLCGRSRGIHCLNAAKWIRVDLLHQVQALVDTFRFQSYTISSTCVHVWKWYGISLVWRLCFQLLELQLDRHTWHICHGMWVLLYGVHRFQLDTLTQFKSISSQLHFATSVVPVLLESCTGWQTQRPEPFVSQLTFILSTMQDVKIDHCKKFKVLEDFIDHRTGYANYLRYMNIYLVLGSLLT